MFQFMFTPNGHKTQTQHTESCLFITCDMPASMWLMASVAAFSPTSQIYVQLQHSQDTEFLYTVNKHQIHRWGGGTGGK